MGGFLDILGGKQGHVYFRTQQELAPAFQQDGGQLLLLLVANFVEFPPEKISKKCFWDASWMMLPHRQELQKRLLIAQSQAVEARDSKGLPCDHGLSRDNPPEIGGLNGKIVHK